jgi:hypothetical protein
MATRGRPRSMPWDAQRVADLLGVPAARVKRACAATPRIFFPGAFEEKGEWMIPERDVRALVGPGLPQLLRIREFADLVGLSVPWVYELVHLGIIAHRRVLGQIRIPATAYWDIPEARPGNLPARPSSFSQEQEEEAA